jgi:hypothetical protein
VNSAEVVLAVIDALDASAIPYMLVGSVSSNYYGIGRSAKDADFVIQLDDQSISAFARSLGRSSGWTPRYRPRRLRGRLGTSSASPSSPFTIELFYPNRDPHNRERFRRRRTANLLNIYIYII